MAEAPPILIPYSERMSFHKLIHIRVGAHDEHDSSNVFIVHRDILTARSEFCYRYFYNNPESQELQLLICDKMTFHLYLHLTYLNEIACAPETINSQTIREQQCWLAKLYVLCNGLEDISAKNRTVQALRHSIYLLFWRNNEWVINRDMVEIIYKGTVKHAAVRRLLVDIFYYHNECDVPRVELASFPPEFQEDLCVVRMDRCQLGGRYKGDHPESEFDVERYLEGFC
ncbi:hypothetical protein E8E13_010185 [Curvularia kusanoi]|uniref:BTB domain-containing protein n=1 Tax=Curvularia kusanoi TaxID=90978 RepID=A0A9P4WDB7_CURKU|nr:hypothetical protein E8E13_010185 [Curvularia kusanoi]